MGNTLAPKGFSAPSRSKNGNLVWVIFTSALTPQLLQRVVRSRLLVATVQQAESRSREATPGA